jgi:hypothetical protein
VSSGYEIGGYQNEMPMEIRCIPEGDSSFYKKTAILGDPGVPLSGFELKTGRGFSFKV